MWRILIAVLIVTLGLAGCSSSMSGDKRTMQEGEMKKSDGMMEKK